MCALKAAYQDAMLPERRHAMADHLRMALRLDDRPDFGGSVSRRRSGNVYIDICWGGGAVFILEGDLTQHVGPVTIFSPDGSSARRSWYPPSSVLIVDSIPAVSRAPWRPRRPPGAGVPVKSL